ncbi:MAG: phosphatase PAP2 family protein [Acidimicrobiia bacterium]|nr:phosphatase PAP2 family protein [Acidimicrobiia bacterium]
MNVLTKLDHFGDKKLTIKRTSSRDAFWFRLSKFADHSAIWIVIGIIKYLFDWNLRNFLIFISVMLIESGLTNGPIKFIFRKKRPYENENSFLKGEKLPYGMRMPITSSFPSGHATSAMCATIVLCSNLNLLYICLIPLALLVGYSRIYTRMHHLSDILFGFLLGIIYGLIVIILFLN